MVTITPQLLYPGKGTQCPLNRRLNRLQSWPECFGEEKYLLPLLGREFSTIHTSILILGSTKPPGQAQD
jgi:hypothetical protein